MVPSNNTAVFFSGSFNFSGSNYRGFVATQATVVDAIAFGSVTTPIAPTTLNPKMTIAAGATIPVWFSAIAATGSIVAYK
jgi:hypothetical protein